MGVPACRCSKIAHEGHQGIIKTKQLLRTKVWWPGINRDVNNLVNWGIPCQAPLHMTTMPSEPWKSIRIDFCGRFPTGENLLVLADACSRWPEVEIPKSTTAETLIRCLEKMFACYGFPEEITSDNGPQFVSDTFKGCQRENVRHRKVTPYWPQANAEVKRSNTTLEKALWATYIEEKDWRREIYTFLQNYRVKPHTLTGLAPAELMFGRNIRTSYHRWKPTQLLRKLRKTKDQSLGRHD